MASNIDVEIEDAVTTITLNRPEKLNAITPEMNTALLAAIDEAMADDAVHAVRLRGAGRRVLRRRRHRRSRNRGPRPPQRPRRHGAEPGPGPGAARCVVVTKADHRPGTRLLPGHRNGAHRLRRHGDLRGRRADRHARDARHRPTTSDPRVLAGDHRRGPDQGPATHRTNARRTTSGRGRPRGPRGGE